MDEKKLWKRFAELDINYKLEILQTALHSLHCTEQRAKELYDTITAELERRWKLDTLARTWNSEREKLILSKLKNTTRKTKKQKLLKYVDEIASLRQNGVGWRKISDYIRKTHKMRVSAETLRQSFKDIL